MFEISTATQLIDNCKKLIYFTRNLYGTPSDSIYLHEPRFIGNEKKYLLEAIDSTFVSSVGVFVNKFEKMMAEITGAKYAVALVNGTAALHIGLKLVGVQQGDEVLMQPLTFIATANALSYEKAIPHFIDVDEDTLGLSPIALRKRLQETAIIRNGQCFNKKTNRRIAACVPMHTFGHALRINEVINICKEYHIPVVEDAAESLGSYYQQKHTGSFGNIGIFSFNGNKTVTCGGGGAIITNDESLAKKAKHITTTAKIPHRWEFVHDEIGYNYRMPNLNAALACAQLEQLDFYLTNKRQTAHLYKDFFEELQGVKFISEPKDSKSNYWLNAIQLNDKASRDTFLEHTNNNKIMTRPIWRLMNKLSMFKDAPKGDLSVAERLEQTIINIPSSVRI